MKTSRKFLIAGNWKMNLNSAEGADLARDVAGQVGEQTEVSVCLCPPFTALESVSAAVRDTNVALGAQNMHSEASGAYTGEVCAEMLRHLYCAYVILGHSERRQYFGETDSGVNKKALFALENNLKPIICVGETLAQREAEETLAVIKTQVDGALAGIGADSAEQLVIAYEPVWAIGTGKTATPEMAQEVHAAIRARVAALLDDNAASRVRILYGGSMKPENAVELLAQADIDGGLIGGAALKSQAFCQIVDAALEQSK